MSYPDTVTLSVAPDPNRVRRLRIAAEVASQMLAKGHDVAEVNVSDWVGYWDLDEDGPEWGDPIYTTVVYRDGTDADLNVCDANSAPVADLARHITA